MNNLTLVFLGGGLGSVTRYLLSFISQKYFHSSFPWYTLAANVISAAILGFLMALIAMRPGQYENQRLLIGAGFCGGLSTFSTFTMESFDLLRTGNTGLAIAYTVISIFTSLLAFWAAWIIQK